MRIGPSGMIAVATSMLPGLSRRNAGKPIDDEYQKLCIRSWVDCGFRILSVNDPAEIPDLSARYPEITFIESARNARALSGRGNPYIADLLSALHGAPEPVVGIINSDLVFEPSMAWQARLPNLITGNIVTGQRHDATSLLDGTFRKYYWGFDFFFFDQPTANELIESAGNFAMGLAWWDYWLPASASLKGHRLLVLERPTIAHLIHKEPSLDTSWRQFGFEFARFVVRGCNGRDDVPPSLRAILPLCRSLAEGVLLDGRTDMQISDMAVRYIPEVTQNPLYLQEKEPASVFSASGGLTPVKVFQRFDQRLRAGKALEKAKRLEKEGRETEAGAEFRVAWERTPADFDVLVELGEYLLRCGNVEGATELLRRASEQQPNSCRVMNGLAACLRTMKRHAEAIACLETALKSEPEDQTTYCNLAIALHESGRQQEAVCLLETALAKWPAFPEAFELYRRLGGALHKS